MDTTKNKMDELKNIFTENLKQMTGNDTQIPLTMLCFALIGDIYRILKENKLNGLEESEERIKKMCEELGIPTPIK